VRDSRECAAYILQDISGTLTRVTHSHTALNSRACATICGMHRFRRPQCTCMATTPAAPGSLRKSSALRKPVDARAKRQSPIRDFPAPIERRNRLPTCEGRYHCGQCMGSRSSGALARLADDNTRYGGSNHDQETGANLDYQNRLARNSP